MKAICTFVVSTVIGLGLSLIRADWGMVAVVCIVGSMILDSIEGDQKKMKAVWTFVVSMVVGIGLSFFVPGAGVIEAICIVGSVILDSIERKKQND